MNSRNAFVECWFLDVGQGTSSIVLLGDRRGIVIDCGPSARIPLRLLRRYVDQIVALVVSHNDKDHHGGASAILVAYQNAIDRVYFLQDRPVERIALFALVKRACEEGWLPSEPIRLERDDRPRVIYADTARNVSLELLFPTFQDNLAAQAGNSSNATSAVLVLFCGSRKVVFPGDAGLEQWQRIHAICGGPIQTDVLSVPHHGANVVARPRARESAVAADARIRKDLQWLYSQGVRCRFAVVSVGTSNDYGHPDPRAVAALQANGAFVICTQITPQCHDDPERLRPGVILPEDPSLSRRNRDTTVGGRSRNVACAGTVIAEVGSDNVVVRRFSEHQRAVDGLAGSAGGHALCRDQTHDS